MRGPRAGRLIGSLFAIGVALLAAEAHAQTAAPAADAGATAPAAPETPPPGPPAPPPAPPLETPALPPAPPPAPAVVVAAPAPPEPPRPISLQTRWETVLYGFAELDAMHDTTQSYGPSSNNTILARPGTYAGTHPRYQLTANNSQVGLRVAAPTFEGIRPSGQVELDFFGALPNDATEATLYTAPSLRLRLFYLRLETPIFDVLAGQYHDLFGWGGAGFYPSSVAFLGIAGEVYHRQPQLRISKVFGGATSLEIAAAAVRPAARDAGVPDLELGIKVAVGGWRGLAMQGFGPPDLAPLAIGISAIGRRFAVAEFLPDPGQPKIEFGGGLALDLFVPLIPVRAAGNRNNALSLNAEVTDGTGIADLYTGLTGGALFPTLPNPGGLVPPPLYRPNIDPGIVTFDANGNLVTINWWAVVVGLQYYLPVDNGRVWVSANASRLQSSNIASLTPEASRGGVFIRQDYLDLNVYFALTPAVQIGLSSQVAHQTFGDMPFQTNATPPYDYFVPESWNYRSEAAIRLFF